MTPGAPRRDFLHAGPIYLTVFVVALANRLVPVLRGGGLSGVLGYDDGVYYAGAVALVHGRLPYRDFLLLHPPGVLLALAPVAAVGRWAGEVVGWEVSRLVWMLMGCCTSLLVVKILRPLGSGPAIAAGLAYAMFPGAVLVERTTLLEGLANFCLAGALALLAGPFESAPRRLGGGRSGRGGPWRPRPGTARVRGRVKISYLVPLTVVCGFAFVALGWRCGAAIVAGAGVVIGAVSLPFILAAPSAMWRMVVLDQIGRNREGDAGVIRRLADIVTMDHAPRGGIGLAVGPVIIVVLVVVCLWSGPCGGSGLRSDLVGHDHPDAGISDLFPHYLGAVAVPGAMVLGGAVDRFRGGLPFRRQTHRPRHRRRHRLGADLVSLAVIQSGDSVPVTKLATVVQPAAGCITADDPNVLLALGVVGRNAQRECELVIDLGGYSHDLSRGTAISRRRNVQWQQFAVRYLGSGQFAVVTRFGEGNGFSTSTAKEVQSWPVLVRRGRLRRAPHQRAN